MPRIDIESLKSILLLHEPDFRRRCRIMQGVDREIADLNALEGHTSRPKSKEPIAEVIMNRLVIGVAGLILTLRQLMTWLTRSNQVRINKRPKIKRRDLRVLLIRLNKAGALQ